MHLIQHDIIRLRVDTARQAVVLQLAGQPYFYSKYKVYQTRWFAILKLVDQHTDRTLILNSDCFQSVECYRRLRFDLRQLERSNVA
jgi:L-cysteine desulfidase